MSTQPLMDAENELNGLVAPEAVIHVRDVQASSRQARRGSVDEERIKDYRRNGQGERVRTFTTKMKKEEIMRLLLVNKTTREIAGMMRLSITTIRDYIRDWEFQQELKEKNFGIWQRIDEEITLSRMSKTSQLDEMGDRALEVMRSLLESEDEKVQLKAASDVLDRGKETSKHHKVEATNLTFNVPADALILAAQTALELEGGPRSTDVNGIREGLPDAT